MDELRHKSANHAIHHSWVDDVVAAVNKVITAMVIGPLDDHTYCAARSAFTHLGLWRKMDDCSLHHFASSRYILRCILLTFLSTSNQLPEI